MSYTTHENELGLWHAVWGTQNPWILDEIAEENGKVLDSKNAFSKDEKLAQKVEFQDPIYESKYYPDIFRAKDLRGNWFIYFIFELKMSIYAAGLLVKPSNNARKFLRANS